ncbi:MAG: IS200/IS605 family transposase [Pirellulaceae bacterium]
MSGHVFHEIYLHFNWHTKLSRPLLTASLEPDVHDFLRRYAERTKGVCFHGLGGTATHIHLAVNIAPSVNISDFVGNMKGACSCEINKLHRTKSLEWQRGYGVVSFGKRQLNWVLEYIANQKEHHARRTIHERLERVTMDNIDSD